MLYNLDPFLIFRFSRMGIKSYLWSPVMLGYLKLIEGFMFSFARCPQLCRHPTGLPGRYGVTSRVSGTASEARSMVRRTGSQCHYFDRYHREIEFPQRHFLALL